MRNFPRPPVFRNHPIAALATICLSVFVISVDATIVNVALPTLSRELNADTAQLQWIVDAYTLVMAGLLLSVGSLSDRYGRRGLLKGGGSAFCIRNDVCRCGAGELGGSLDRGPRRDGGRRRGDLSDHARSDHEYLHGPGAAGQGNRRLGGDGRCRRRRRTTDRWLAS